MRLDDVETLLASGRSTALQIQLGLKEIYKALETSAATRFLSAIDVSNAQIAIAMVGMFSIYESRLQAVFGWDRPFDELTKLLAAKGLRDEAERFEEHRLAINVLKHGTGASHKKLLERSSRLTFKVRANHSDGVDEGDVCPPSDLVVVTVELLLGVCDCIEQSWGVIRETK